MLSGSTNSQRRAHLTLGPDAQQSQRVRVTSPLLSASPWAPTLRDLAGPPRVGDQVLVGFEQGELDFPYVVGVLATGPRPTEVRIDASQWTFSGVVKADRVIANSVVAASYSPGAGNIW